MKQDYFENKMREMLDKGEEQPFEMRQWRNLRTQLDNADGQPMAWWLRWMPLGFLILIGLLGWQSWRQYRLQGEFEELTTMLSEQQINQQSLTEERRTTVVFDTVYRRITIEENVRQPAGQYAPGPGLTSSLWTPTTGQFTAFYPETKRPPSPATYSSLASYLAGERAAVAAAEVDELRLLAVGPINLLPGVGPYRLGFNRPLPSTSIAPAFAPEEMFRNPLWPKIKPKSYTLEGGIGSQRDWAFSDEEGISGYLGLEAALGKRISLTLGGSYLQRFFKRGEDDLPVTGLPLVEALNPTDELEGVSGNLNFLQIPVGIRLYGIQSEKVGIYLEGGIGVALGFSDNITTIYEEVDDNEYSLVNKSPLSTSLKPNFYYLRAGFNYRLGERLQARFDLMQQDGIGQFDFEYQRPKLLHWRVGVGWRL